MNDNFKYCPSLIKYDRRKSSVVDIGNVRLGGDYPIRLQSMTTTDTMDTKKTVEQSIRMIEAGSEYVRITAPSIKEAENLKQIKKKIRKSGFETPLIADIHFTPNAAETAARIVEKVRINPGNYADRKKFKLIEYSDSDYDAELDRIYTKFSPLVKICKEYGTALRIGTNHGSLSDRIMNRYGDTPEGMVESALEFLRICEDLNYYNTILSMKSSNPVVMVQAYRLLVNHMDRENMNYPLHIGVTEAGEGVDGRIKSAVGIGTLLEDGLGDTIRVSLTEEPEFEIPVAKEIVNRYSNRKDHNSIEYKTKYSINPFEYNLRITKPIKNIGGDNVPVVIADLSNKNKITAENLAEIGYIYHKQSDKWTILDSACDYIYIGNHLLEFNIPGTLKIINNYTFWRTLTNNNQTYPLLNAEQYLSDDNKSNSINFIQIVISELNDNLVDKLKGDNSAILIINTDNLHGMAEQRQIFFTLLDKKCEVPVIISRDYINMTLQQLQVYTATDIGALFVDGLGDGMFISVLNHVSEENINNTAFGILQATRRRVFKTEYISCPSCGRTLFNLQETTAKVRDKTNHLKGVKIAVMGCIVNGPGEMADADYGYVGTGFGKISLYKGKEVVKKNIPSTEAVEELIQLIKMDGNWDEPSIQ